MPELFGRSIATPELFKRIGRFEQVAGDRFVTLEDGAERRVRVLQFHTGTGFRFEVIVERAMDFGRCELGEPIILQPGEPREYCLELGALDGNEAIDAFASCVLMIAKTSSS
jgi:hypothetical protein